MFKLSSPVSASCIKQEVSIVLDQKLIVISFYIVAEWSTCICSTRLHPETYGGLSETGHAPDVDVRAGIFVWEVKSVICLKSKNGKGRCYIKLTFRL